MNTFENAMKKMTNLSVTENGSLAHITTFEPLLDCNYGVSAARLYAVDLLENWKEAFNREAITAISEIVVVVLVKDIVSEFFSQSLRK